MSSMDDSGNQIRGYGGFDSPGGSHKPLVLDMCCGPRHWWFDKDPGATVFVDNRNGVERLKGNGWSRQVAIKPSVQADYRALPFAGGIFDVVLFDPPHLVRHSPPSGFIRRKYGQLSTQWRADLGKAFSEGFRVLKPAGLLMFKWSEPSIAFKEVLELAPRMPIVGDRWSRTDTKWAVFING